MVAEAEVADVAAEHLEAMEGVMEGEDAVDARNSGGGIALGI